EADRATKAVDYGKLAEFSRGQERDGIADAGAARDGGGAGGHDFGDGAVEGGFAATLEDAGQVAIGEEAGQSAVGIGEHDRAGAPARARAGDDDLADGLAVARGAAFVERSHDVVHTAEL